MMRRAIPWTSSVGLLLVAVLLVADTVTASRPGARVPDLRGRWDGYFVDAGGGVGVIRSDITQQNGRRFAGNGGLFDASTGGRLAAYNVNGTIAADDLLTASGKTASGRVTLQGDVRVFAGSKGNAEVLDAQLRFIPRRGQPVPFGATLLRPFPDGHAPDVSGDGAGTFGSATDPTFAGDLALQMDPRDRGTFPGLLTCTFPSGQHAAFTWPTRATLNEQGRLVLIAQGKSGKMIVDGSVSPGKVSVQGGATVRAEATPTWSVDARFSLLTSEGRTDFGAWNFSITPTHR